MSKVPEKNIKERWDVLDRKREDSLERARSCAAITVPSLLMPKDKGEDEASIQQFSSVASRGVTSLSSKILGALLPLNDTSFFKLALTNGRKPDLETVEYLELLSSQIYKKLLIKNMRDSIYLMLQHLIVTGNSLIIMDNDFSFRVVSLDQYVVRRSVQGDVKELIYVEYLSKPNEDPAEEYHFQHGQDEQPGFDTVYVRITHEDDGSWYMEKEVNEIVIDSGYFDISPFIVLRWTSVTNEDYGRGHVEDLYGDIITLESYSRSLLQGMAAGSTFFMGVDPAGLTELEDLSSATNGDWVAARQQDVFAISPSQTMNPQVQTSQAAVETMRKEVASGFLMQAAVMPTGDRVTATAIRAVGNELESILGGTFSAIARELMEPLVRRTIVLMLNNNEIDEGLRPELQQEGGIVSIEIITGLQALSREGDLTKLLQMGEMVRNLPEQAANMFKWDAYARSVVLGLGFDPKLWVKSEEEVMAEQRAMQEEQAARERQQMLAQGGVNAMQDTARIAAEQGNPIQPDSEDISAMQKMFGGA